MKKDRRIFGDIANKFLHFPDPLETLHNGKMEGLAHILSLLALQKQVLVFQVLLHLVNTHKSIG
jgi:hypothetical protein